MIEHIFGFKSIGGLEIAHLERTATQIDMKSDFMGMNPEVTALK